MLNDLSSDECILKRYADYQDAFDRPEILGNPKLGRTAS